MGRFSSSHEIPENMKDTINACAVGLGFVGIPGGILGPGADLVVIAPTWVGMTVALADQAGHAMSKQTAKKIALAVAAGGGAFAGGTKIASTAIGWLAAPFTLGASLAISAAANAGLNASFTYAYGRAAARYFLQTREIDNIEVMVGVLIALIGADLGFNTEYDHLIS